MNDLVAGQSQKLPGIPRISDKQLEVKRGGGDSSLCCGLPVIAAWTLHSPPAPTWHAHTTAPTLATPRRPSSTWPSWPTTPSCTWSGVSLKAGRHADGLPLHHAKAVHKIAAPMCAAVQTCSRATSSCSTTGEAGRAGVQADSACLRWQLFTSGRQAISRLLSCAIPPLPAGPTCTTAPRLTTTR